MRLSWTLAIAAIGGPACKQPVGPISEATLVDTESLFTLGYLGEEFLEVAGDVSGVQEGLIVDPREPMVLEGLSGDDCTESLVFLQTPFVRRPDGSWVEDYPVRPSTMTLGPDLVMVGIGEEGADYQWPDASYRLLDRTDPRRWTVEVASETVCEVTSLLEPPDCAPTTLETLLIHQIEAPGESQATLADAMQYFDVVPSPDWTFEGIDLPPCVPRLK